MISVMCDLETYGLAPGSIVRSLGAVSFDPDRPDLGEATFYANIDHASCEAAGLTWDQSTVDWWANQSAVAKAHLESPAPRPLVLVAADFHQWFKKQSARYLWCQGASFDAVLWEAACHAVKAPVPWRYYHVRDTRTAYDLARLDPQSVPREGTHHSALDDARHQVRCVREAVRRIGGQLAVRRIGGQLAVPRGWVPLG